MEYYTQPQKEPLWVSSSEVDEPRVCYTEWSRSEKENQILYINTYIHMESRKTVLMNLSTGKEWRRHRCREWTHGRRRGKRERDEQRKPRQHIYTITCKTDSWWKAVTQGPQAGALWWPRGMGSEERRMAQEGGDICVIIADVCCRMAKTNTTLQSNFPPIKK